MPGIESNFEEFRGTNEEGKYVGHFDHMRRTTASAGSRRMANWKPGNLDRSRKKRVEDDDYEEKNSISETIVIPRLKVTRSPKSPLKCERCKNRNRVKGKNHCKECRKEISANRMAELRNCRTMVFLDNKPVELLPGGMSHLR